MAGAPMIVFTKLAGLGAPPWAEDSPAIALRWDKFWLPDMDGDYYPLATSSCSNGHLASVSPKVHSIASDGTLSPSYVCPRAGCSFHEFVRFEGWAP